MQFFLVIILPIILVLCIFAPIILLFNLNFMVMSDFFQLSISDCNSLFYALESKVDDLKSCLSSGLIKDPDVKNIIFEQAVNAKYLILRLKDYEKTFQDSCLLR